MLLFYEKKLESRQYEGELDFFEYSMFVTKTMKEINPNEPEKNIVSKICDGLPSAERDYIWRYRPETLDALNTEFSHWLEHKEKMKRKTESEKDKAIEKLTFVRPHFDTPRVAPSTPRNEP